MEDSAIRSSDEGGKLAHGSSTDMSTDEVSKRKGETPKKEKKRGLGQTNRKRSHKNRGKNLIDSTERGKKKITGKKDLTLDNPVLKKTTGGTILRASHSRRAKTKNHQLVIEIRKRPDGR